MCLAVPVRIVEIEGDEGIVSLEGVRQKADFSLIESPAAGDYVLVHAGFAIEKWTDNDVEDYKNIMNEITPAEVDNGE